MNWKIKVQNPAFWYGMVIGIFSIIGGYFGITAPDLTSWTVVTNTLGAAIASPYVVGMIVVYVMGLFIDLSTFGWKDSEVTRAKTSIDQTAQDIVNLQLKQASEKVEKLVEDKTINIKTEKECE